IARVNGPGSVTDPGSYNIGMTPTSRRSQLAKAYWKIWFPRPPITRTHATAIIEPTSNSQLRRTCQNDNVMLSSQTIIAQLGRGRVKNSNVRISTRSIEQTLVVDQYDMRSKHRMSCDMTQLLMDRCIEVPSSCSCP